MIDIYVNEVRRALRHQCYFPALALALALPDICGMAEFPDMRVTDRYVAWYDKYLGNQTARSGQFDDTPYLSGEMVYNLRNTYLHQGSPNVQREKVREEVNQIDRFILVLGDGTRFRETSFSMRISSAETGIVYLRRIYVEVTYLCGLLCDGALQYYKQNREKFRFDFSILPQEALLGEDSPLSAAARMGEPLAGLGTAPGFGMPEGVGKLREEEKSGSGGNPAAVPGTAEKRETGGKTAASGTAEKRETGGKTAASGTAEKRETGGKTAASGTAEKRETGGKTAAVSKEGERDAPEGREEHRLRCFFGEHFKEDKYRERREDIIGAVLASDTKARLNQNLMKLFSGGDVKILLQRLEPMIKNLPPENGETRKPETEKKQPSREPGKQQTDTPGNGAPSEKGTGGTISKKERQIRGVFEANFKEPKYLLKREDIIGAVRAARSKQQLNNALMKLFPGEDVKVILKRFREQIKNLPGK